MHSEIAFDAEEIEHVEGEVTGDLEHLAFRAVEVERDRGGRAGAHFELGGAGTVVDDLIASPAGLVERDFQRGGAEREAVDTDQADATGGALQAGPVARGFGLAGGEHQGEVERVELDPERVGATAVQAGEGADVAPAQREQVDLHGLRRRGVVRVGVGQGDHAVALLQRQLARDSQEAEQIDVQPAGGAQQLAVTAGHVEVETAARPGADVEALGGEVDHRLAGGVVGTVDLDRKVAGSQRQAVHTDEADAAGRGLQRGPAACGVGAAARQPFAHQGETEVDAAEREAEGFILAAVEAGEGIDAGAADGEQVDVDLLGRGGRVVVAIGQRDAAGLALDGEAAVGLEKPEQVQAQVATGAQQRAVGAVHAEAQRAARTGGDLQRVGAVVEQAAVGLGRSVAGLVDFDEEFAAAQGQPVQADQAGTVGAGFQTQPFARIGDVGLFAGQRQRELHTGQLQPQRAFATAAQAREGVDAAPTQREQVDRDLAGRAGVAAVVEGDGVGAAFEGEVARELQEAEHVQPEVTGGLELVAFGAIQRQRLTAAGAGGHLQVARLEVDHRAVGGGLVDKHAQPLGADGQTVDTGQADALGFGLQRAPLARAVAGRNAFAQQRQREIDASQLQADGAAGTAVDAGEGGDTGAAQREQVDLDLGSGGVVEQQRGAALVEGKTASHPEETVHVERELTAGAQQFAGATIHVQLVRAARPGGHGQRHGQPIDQAAVHGGAVDLDAERVGADRDTAQSGEADVCGHGTQRGPLACGILAVGGDRQREGDILQFQADRARRAAADTGKRVDTGRTHGQQFDLDHLRRHVVGGVGVRQRHCLRALFDGEVALQTHEAEQVQLQVTGCLQQFATRTVEIDGDGLPRSHQHVQRTRAGEIHHRRTRAGMVEGDVQAVRRQRDAGQTGQRDRAGAALERRPLACRIVGVGQQRQREIEILHREADEAGRTGMEPHLGVQTEATDGEQFGVYRAVVRQGTLRHGAATYRQTAAGSQQTTHVQAGAADGDLAQRRHQIGLEGVFQIGRPQHDVAVVGGGLVPADRHGGGGERDQLAQLGAERAFGLQHPAVGADTQAQRGIVDADCIAAGSQPDAGVRGDDDHGGAIGTGFEGKVATDGKPVTQAGGQAGYPRRLQTGGGGQAAEDVLVIAGESQGVATVVLPGLVETHTGRFGADLGEAAAAQRQRTAALERDPAGRVDDQAELAVVQADADPASGQTGTDAMTGHPDGASGQRNADRAGQMDITDAQADAAGQQQVFTARAVVVELETANRERRGGQVDHRVVGRAAGQRAVALTEREGEMAAAGGQRAQAQHTDGTDAARTDDPAVVQPRRLRIDEQDAEIGVSEAETLGAGVACRTVQSEETGAVGQAQVPQADVHGLPGHRVGDGLIRAVTQREVTAEEEAVGQIQRTAEGDAGRIQEIVVVEPFADTVGRGADHGIQHESGKHIQFARHQRDAGVALPDLEPDAVAGMQQPGAGGETPAHRAIGHDVEAGAILRAETIDQRHRQRAIQAGQPGDVDLVVLRAGGQPADLDLQRAGGGLGERGDVLHARRIAGTERAGVEDADVQTAAAAQRFVGGDNEHAVEIARPLGQPRHVVEDAVDREIQGLAALGAVDAGLLQPQRLRIVEIRLLREDVVGADVILVGIMRQQGLHGAHDRIRRQQHAGFQRFDAERIAQATLEGFPGRQPAFESAHEHE